MHTVSAANLAFRCRRNKKVVIHVPYKVKKIKHVHTVYKTVHHHHKPSVGYEHEASHQHHVAVNGEEHEHFHHMHLHEDGAQHSQPVPGIGIPEFLPDVPLEDDMAEVAALGARHHIPLYRRAVDMNALGYA